MCGIGGQFAYYGQALSEDLAPLERMSLRMRPRGPDGSGMFVSDDRRVGLVHRRLAIIDLSEAGVQPMHDPSTGLTIVFNGEIYNYRQLRAELAGLGHMFRSNSDTEVLLKLYAEHGREMLGKLRGMFAFALWDERRGRLLLARDPFGIKPLYIADDGHTLRFASQVKALLATGKIETSPDPAGETGFFLWGHIPEPFTLYREIRALPPGTSLSIDREGVKRVHQYFSLPRRMEALEPLTSAKSSDEARAVLSEALRESVRYHLISDVSVGVFLSSGLDSCTLFALAAEAQAEPPVALTLGFREFENTEHDEVPLAGLVARDYDAQGQVHRISQKDFAACYGRLMEFNGSAEHRRHQHLFRLQSRGGKRPESGLIRPRRRRAFRGLSGLREDPAARQFVLNPIAGARPWLDGEARVSPGSQGLHIDEIRRSRRIWRRLRRGLHDL